MSNSSVVLLIAVLSASASRIRSVIDRGLDSADEALLSRVAEDVETIIRAMVEALAVRAPSLAAGEGPNFTSSNPSPASCEEDHRARS
jgi:hypothetical protein